MMTETSLNRASKAMGRWSELRQTLTRQRIEKGVSREWVARLCGVSQQSVENWEKAKRDPTALNLFLWADSLGVILQAQ